MKRKLLTLANLGAWATSVVAAACFYLEADKAKDLAEGNGVLLDTAIIALHDAEEGAAALRLEGNRIMKELESSVSAGEVMREALNSM